VTRLPPDDLGVAGLLALTLAMCASALMAPQSVSADPPRFRMSQDAIVVERQPPLREGELRRQASLRSADRMRS
jgi:hypothetical protein